MIQVSLKKAEQKVEKKESQEIRSMAGKRSRINNRKFHDRKEFKLMIKLVLFHSS